MAVLILVRLLQAVPVLLTVGLIAFAMFAYVGDPVLIMLGQDYSEPQRAAMVHQLGLDQPFLVQYLDFIVHALHGDFGISYRLARPVGGLILERFPATFELVLTAALLSLALGVPLGVATGIRPRGRLSRLILAASLAGVSLPTFLLGILLILVFSVTLGWLPSYGRGDVVQIGGWTTGFLTASGMRALVLPSVTLGMFQLNMILRLIRGEMMEVLQSDYIKFARARGLPDRAIHFRHALRNTLVPVITVVGLQIGGLLAFSIITESVFQWPGMGLLLVQSIASADIPVMGAYLMLVGAVFVVINLAVDLLYHAVDPRLRAGTAR